jgi:hypothetical protein
MREIADPREGAVAAVGLRSRNENEKGPPAGGPFLRPDNSVASNLQIS